ncbi:MAG: glutamine synthetase family protein [Treponema sp.]|uniref:glutamine synthetase family protein n=1 Tax=Treponema sp. TaxID=166 RepID=UPI00298DB0B0|nr:glutamine synthetase family protein [Treponema sp.]MDD5810519.1 glutamine synthetase family protein [Treponema sp.]
MYTESEVLEFVKEEDVKFVRLAFFDVKGKQKNISIMADQLHRAFELGISFDASAIDGFESPDKSDLFLHPDPTTLSVLPWRPNTGKVCRMFCNIKYPDGTPYEKDCRTLLKNAIKYAKEKYNLSLSFGPEVEFYLFKLNEAGESTKIPFDNAGYMDIAPEDKGENIRRDICFTLESMGIIPEASHHEEGPGQNEIDFKYSDALTAADNTATFKWIVRTRAASNGLYADFSPKPLEGQAGSGFHINVSLSDESKMPNAIAGILKHAEELTYFLNTTEESYNRLGECKAPKYICWGNQNRSTMIRVPATKKIKRLEIRSADPECNPYIAFALIIYAALDGIENNLVPPAPVEENLFANTSKNDIKVLPDTLDLARKIADESEFVKKVLKY